MASDNKEVQLTVQDQQIKSPPQSTDDVVESKGSSGRVSCWHRVLYGVGDINASTTTMILGFHYNYFLLNVACVTPANCAIILLVSRVWDGVNDPVIGYLSDNTRTRWGRRIPWILGGMVPYAVSYVFIWFVPAFEGGAQNQGAILAYFTIMVFISSPFFTAVNLPYAALAADMTEDSHERTILNMFRFTFSLQAALIAAAFQQIVVDNFYAGGSTYQEAYVYTAIIISGVCIIIPSLLLGCGYKETFVVDEEADKKKVGFWAGWCVAAKNKAYMCVLANFLLSWMVIQFVQNNLKLYIQYVLNIESHFTYIIVCLMECNFFSIMLWTYVAGKIGKKKTFYAGCIGFTACLAGLYLLPENEPVFAYITASMAGLFIGVCYLIPWAMLPDVIEWDELQTGERREGIYYSFFMMGQKVIQGLGIAASNWILASVDYVNPPSQCDPKADGMFEVDQQKPAVIQALRLMVSVIPCGFMILACIPIYYYPIDEKKHAEMLRQLDEKRKKKREAQKQERIAQTATSGGTAEEEKEAGPETRAGETQPEARKEKAAAQTALFLDSKVKEDVDNSAGAKIPDETQVTTEKEA